jgi:hypothetical protein
MVIEEGIGLVLAYLLVSAGVIIIFLVAVFVVGWFVGRLHVRRRRQRGEESCLCVDPAASEMPWGDFRNMP